MKLPIPDDWDEQTNGYMFLIACVPNSPMWRSHYRGKFYELTWWKVWDKDTGQINDAKAVANDVYKGLCMANCDDLILQLIRIADALEAIQQSEQTAQQNQETREILDSINEILGGDSVVPPETVPNV